MPDDPRENPLPGQKFKLREGSGFGGRPTLEVVQFMHGRRTSLAYRLDDEKACRIASVRAIREMVEGAEVVVEAKV